MKLSRKGLQGIITYVILYVGLSSAGFYPLLAGGKSFIWCIDSAGQYFPAFVYIGKYMQRFLGGLASGNIILPHFDLSIGMGEGIIGCLNYYGFGDPFNLIAVFVNDSNAGTLFAIAYFLRMFCAGCAFMYYLSLLGMDSRIRSIGAVCYVFSGFALCGSLMYLSWGSVLFYFPLMLSGVEKIIRRKRDFMLLAVSVFFGALCGFYFLYMSSLALAVYCLVRFSFTVKHTIKNCAFCVAVYLGGAIAACPILIPTIKAFFSSERNSGAYDIIFNYHYYIPRIGTLLSVIRSTLVPERYGLWFGVFAVQWIMIIVLFILPNTKRRMQLKIAVVLFLAASSVKITGYAFNAFGETNDRYSFLLHFLCAVVACDVFTHILSSKDSHKPTVRYAVIALYLFTCVNVLFNSFGLYSPLGRNWQEEFVGRSEAAQLLSSPVGNFKEIADDYEKGEVFRVSLDHYFTANDRPENVAMISDYYGTTYWFSIVNGYTQKYVDDYNEEEMIWRSYGYGDDLHALTLSGCKYIIDNPGTNEEALSVNPLYKGFAFVCDESSLKKIEESQMSVSQKNQAIYDIADYDSVKNFRYDNLKNECVCDIECFEEGEEGAAKVLVTAFPYSSGWRAYINGKQVDITRTEMFCSVPLDGLHNSNVTLTYN